MLQKWMGPPIHLIPWRKTMMKNVQDQNFKPEIATQISVQIVPQPVSLNFFYLYKYSQYGTILDLVCFSGLKKRKFFVLWVH